MGSKPDEGETDNLSRDEIDALKDLKEDAKEVIDHENSWARQSDQELISFIRLNVAVLGIFAAGFYYVNESLEQVESIALLGLIFPAIIFWSLNIGIAMLAYKGIIITGGIPEESGYDLPDSINGLSCPQNLSVDIKRYYSHTVSNHLRSISINARELEYRYALQAGAVYLMLIAVFVFSFSIGYSSGIEYFNIMYYISVIIGALVLFSLLIVGWRFKSKDEEDWIPDWLWKLSVKIVPLDTKRYDYSKPQYDDREL